MIGEVVVSCFSLAIDADCARKLSRRPSGVVVSRGFERESHQAMGNLPFHVGAGLVVLRW